VFSDDPGIGGDVVVEFGFAPVVGCGDGAPLGVVGVFGENFGDVVWSAGGVVCVPRPVENSDEAVAAQRAAFGAGGEMSAEGVGGDPCVAAEVPIGRRSGVGGGGHCAEGGEDAYCYGVCVHEILRLRSCKGRRRCVVGPDMSIPAGGCGHKRVPGCGRGGTGVGE